MGAKTIGVKTAGGGAKANLRACAVGATIEGRVILRGINLTLKSGRSYVIMGPNGAGKSTLARALAGVTDGIKITGKIYHGMNKAQAGQKAELPFLAWQEPPAIAGVSVEELLLLALKKRLGPRFNLKEFYDGLAEKLELLDLPPEFAERELNVAMSGGEKKKSEILQMMMLDPVVAILDEPDSGLDVDAVKAVARGVKNWRDKNPELKTLVIITHDARLLAELTVDETIILENGRIKQRGGKKLIEEILAGGFNRVNISPDE